ncbi:hypothetical protein KHA80_02705 [Anaerobacillus sp. HL2]|nr:hypothetical protein KHA80_02705 [Anaerobacillus sp. HL2]
MLDGYASQTGHHINVNVFDREQLMDAMEHPESIPVNDPCIWLCCKLY